MRAHLSSLTVLASAAALFALFSPQHVVQAAAPPGAGALIAARDEHAHGHVQGAPLLELNETMILEWHKPTPPSYGTHDFEDPDVDHKYPSLMGLHAFFMTIAFFGALPVGIALRSVNHGLHGVSVALFYVFIVLGLASSALYRKLTPNMYQGAKHGMQGYFVILFAAVITAIDAFALLNRAFHYISAVRHEEIIFSVKAFWKTVVLNKESDMMLGVSKNFAHEYAGLVEEPEELDLQELKAAGDLDHVDIGIEHVDASLQSPVSDENTTERWAKDVRTMHQQYRGRRSAWRRSLASDGTLFSAHPSRRESQQSDETLHILPAHVQEAKLPLVRRVGRGAFAAAERVLVFLGYMQVLTGIVTYTGVCRDSYVNGCLAHLIKGGIFWCYGLVTFARFLGSFSELGWAWNRVPGLDRAPSAEFVESLVIFLYGISNTWMERFGVPAGAPFTTKQIQHISIAVMFWFAGLVGMGIESKTIRRWLATPAVALASPSSSIATNGSAAPAAYQASFNPFPALVIGVTGLAMSAHTQVYLFQVQIHALWGQLLAGFALLRCLTYFFVWLSPPVSVLPSRPPTEALASFFLACGGLTFQLSLEELNLAAMRRGQGDVMMFLNFAVAVTCLAFCWVLGVVTLKAWLKTRQVAHVALSNVSAHA
ncbi:hypothetical protein EW145_g5110 [Phellinidium pouzarii]|uniref:Cytoplasmic protein n=1 Tax=Phellinidium pouzarii TaxID=167371 RepID=A0A4S4L2J5_9AGAM|nr:hypothetical protein EW145_g5110 [Phellinidium pouzarii]